MNRKENEMKNVIVDSFALFIHSFIFFSIYKFYWMRFK